MKKLLLVVCVVELFVFVACKTNSPFDTNKYLKRHWNENVPEDKLIYGDGDFYGFNGDGEMYAVYDVSEIDNYGEGFNDPSSCNDIMNEMQFRVSFDRENIPVLNNVPEELRFDFNKDYYWKYRKDGSGGFMYVLYEEETGRLYYIVWVS